MSDVEPLDCRAALYSPDTTVGSVNVAATQVRFGIKVAQMTGLYNEGMKDAWLEADHLGFDTAWGHDHLLNQNDRTGAPCAGLFAARVRQLSLRDWVPPRARGTARLFADSIRRRRLRDLPGPPP